MNPLPRLLGMGLLVVLTALAALLGGPLWRAKPLAPPALHGAEAATTTPPKKTRLVEFSRRLTFSLALTGVVLAAALLASLTTRGPRNGESRAPFRVQRTEIGALAKLAESSVAQGAALAKERDERQRAEADALLNQQRLNRSLEEKIQLGRDLHDGLIQSLYAAGLTIESARSVAKTDSAEADRQLGQCLGNLNQAIRDVRAHIVGLGPENLSQATFTEALNRLVAELGAGRKARFDLKIDDTATAQLSPEQCTEALQVAREAVSNGLRHSGATVVTVRLHPGDGEVCLLVQDDGCGFDSARRSGAGHGLANMQARAKRLGASVRIESAVDSGGTRVILTLPVQAG